MKSPRRKLGNIVVQHAVNSVKGIPTPVKSPPSMGRSHCRKLSATAASAGGLFFPNRVALGFDARQFTPLMVQRMMVAAAETRSFKRAAIVIKHVAGQEACFKTIQRITHEVGTELQQRRDGKARTGQALVQTPHEPPDLAVIETDGGRIHTRLPGKGPGVHLAGKGWRETKNACLIRAQRKTFTTDPQPDPPDCFLDAHHVAKIAETAAPNIVAADSNAFC